ncbi:sucrose-6-phosphate hydrolase [Pyronema domesticum]|uniref:Similar to Beta-fructofuranosidase, soluble isoenzyme I acc. no. P80065 n=1 Tax=Pyronema omphalodes (strain CBS 100304) TaxID=1076935 RepID=U4LN04_PYROM|nr:sucrose-6-phosphate hydrolase [Pyronema domesticum]CCX33524.1 Similar to Beta-fructofuranosidase, soluble isoenzyme I; acc. no. P80065 [Pyronema omphalodes CBS 100304]
MKFSTLLPAALAAFAYSVSAADINPADDLDTYGNNTLFTRWRPQYHFTAPAGWMNDPCGAVYDHHTKLYHVMYQWNPNHVQWGNISWGHAVSDDLVNWKDIRDWKDSASVSLTTGPDEYDELGIFTGTIQPTNLTGHDDGTLTAFYTSIRALPTNWRIPYIPGTESQSLATSVDGGKTWQKYEGNPIMEGHPEGWNITGFRDPYYHKWPEMDTVLGREPGSWYMVIGSGIKGVGPRIPLYVAEPHDLTKWKFLGALWEPKANETFGDVLETGSYGYNFEVSNFLSINDEDGDIHYYVTMGAEGGSVPAHGRWSLWSEGSVHRRDNGSAEFTVQSSGVSDWGNLYALTAFKDTKHDRYVQWGWAEEEMNNYGVRAQGFQGAFGLPRALVPHKTKGLKATAGLTAKSANILQQHEDGTFTATTLGTYPLKDVVKALQKSADKSYEIDDNKVPAEARSAHFALKAKFEDVKGPVGVVVLASADGQEKTTITYDPAEALISVDRSQSSLITQFNNFTASGHFDSYGEDIELDVFVDGSLIEVFANKRFALTSRAYPSKEDSKGISVFGDAEIEGKIWTGIKSIFPGRPADSSSKLVWDSPEVSGNGTYWPGW